MQHSKRAISFFLLATLFLIHIPAHAAVKTMTGELSLMATVDGKPAFRPVTWQLSRVKPGNHGGKTVKVVHKHTAIVDLEPGQYLVSVTLDGVTHTRHVRIRESQKHSLTIPLD
ncbi:MAG: hypothetical protein R3E89_16235 [Thiolinea sp.]